jgi:membrane protein
MRGAIVNWWRPVSGQGACDLAIRVWKKFWAVDITGLAAQMSYYFVLSIFPFLIIVAALVGTLPFTGVWTTVLKWITFYFPRESQSMIFRTVLGLTSGRTGFLSLGIVGTVWSAANGLLTLMESLNKIYEVPEHRGYFHRLGIAVVMIFVLALMLLSTFGLMTAEGKIDQWLSSHSQGLIAEPALWRVTWWLTSVLVFSLDIAILDRMMPNLHRPRPRVIPGVFFTLFGWLVSTSGFNLYAEHLATFNRTYGVLGVFVLLMVWIYLLSIVFLTGAAINSELTKVKARAA